MQKNTAIRLVDGCETGRLEDFEDTERIDARIHLAGQRADFHIAVRNTLAPLADLAILARHICDKLLEITLEHPANHHHIVCGKGCSACCSYLVGLSPPEIYQLRREFAHMPADDRIPILKACLQAAFKILHQDITQPEINEDTDLYQISEWYASLNLQCPFLTDGLCRIYDKRPLTCREYFVASHPNHCRIDSTARATVVRPHVSVTETLARVAAELEERPDPEAVILPLAVIGTDELSERAKQLYPAPDMVRRFLNALEKHGPVNVTVRERSVGAIL